MTLATVGINQICLNSYSRCLIKNAVNVLKIWTPFLFLQIAYNCNCSPRTDDVKVVPEFLYIAMIDSLRQQVYPWTKQAGRDRKISDSRRKENSCPMSENWISQLIDSDHRAMQGVLVIPEVYKSVSKKKRLMHSGIHWVSVWIKLEYRHWIIIIYSLQEYQVLYSSVRVFSVRWADWDFPDWFSAFKNLGYP